MRFKKEIVYLAVLLFACHPTYILESYDEELIAVEVEIDSTILKIITPYQDGIEDEMSKVITYTKKNLEKGKPQSTIGNFVTDLCLNYANADICIMNNGGLRTSIDKGEVTKGKLYELMPFENELVLLELDKYDYIKLLNYIEYRGGEPFSGITITMNQDGKIVDHSWPVNFDNGDKITVLTSDYLANGGDNMSFFEGKSQRKVGIKLRDAIIDYCSKIDTLDISIDNRITIINHEE